MSEEDMYKKIAGKFAKHNLDEDRAEKLGLLNNRLGNYQYEPKPKTALETQIGGNHYKTLKIQPMEYSMANNLNACQHTAIKYITRYRDKGDPRENIEKAIHTLQLLMELENL